MKWYIGCSGFHYKEWKGIFYPEKLAQKNWFEYYSRHFNTLELNVTFYRFPRLAFLEDWHNKSPADFMFSVKAPRLITHYKKFQDVKQLMDDFYNLSRQGLKEKLGPILFQLPASTTYTEERLILLIKSMDPAFENVIEFRNEGWWQERVMLALRQARICFCGVSYPRLPDEAVINNELVYYRFHGIPKLYYSSYEPKELEKVVKAIKKNKRVEKAFIYFNNTATAAALENAKYMKLITDG